MKLSRFGVFAGLLVASSALTFADVIPVDGTWEEFLFGAVGTYATACPGCTPTINPVANRTPALPYTFSGPATIDVLDLFVAGDQFAVFDNSVLLGDTSSVSAASGIGSCANDISCALTDSAYSQGIFTVGGGSHSITIETIQNASGFSTGGAAVLEATAPVPEPSSVLLFVTATLGVGGALKRRLAR